MRFHWTNTKLCSLAVLLVKWQQTALTTLFCYSTHPYCPDIWQWSELRHDTWSRGPHTSCLQYVLCRLQPPYFHVTTNKESETIKSLHRIRVQPPFLQYNTGFLTLWQYPFCIFAAHKIELLLIRDIVRSRGRIRHNSRLVISVYFFTYCFIAFLEWTNLEIHYSQTLRALYFTNVSSLPIPHK